MDVNTTALTSWKVKTETCGSECALGENDGMEPYGVSGMTVREHTIRHSKNRYKIRQEIDKNLHMKAYLQGLMLY